MTDDLAPVHQLHPDREILTGEVVSDRERALLETPAGRAQLRREGYWDDTRAVVAATGRVIRHHRTRAGAKLVARNVVYIPGGCRVVGRYLWENWTGAGYARAIRDAEHRQDFQAAMELRAKADEERQRRFERIMAYIRAPQELIKTVVSLLALVTFGLLALGIAAALVFRDASLVVGPFRVILWALATVAWVFTVGGTLILAGIAALVVFGLWWAGRREGATPTWLESEDAGRERDDTLDPEVVATALAHLGIPAINKAIKEGWRVQFLMPPTLVNGRGYQMVHSIPLGVTAGMIADKREVYARNLHRAPLEVWPTAYKDSGWVETWVAHPGATERDGSPYPLLHDGTVDVFKAVPMGESQRGDLIAPPLMEASMGVGGLPGQGKSNAVRVIMAGAALDPLADLRVYVFAGNGDFDAYEPRLSVYRRGVDDSVVQDAVDELRALYREVERRETRLAEVGAKKLSRTLASRHPDLRPIVVGFSEVHELFSHPDLGKEASDLAVATVKRMRKCGIFLVFDTQSSRAAAIPSALVELFKYNACFAVKTWRSNDGFLGDGSFQAGIRATELRPGKDRGTSLVTGITEERFELLNWFYIEADDDTGFDAATAVISRSLKKAKVTQSNAAAPEGRDLLDDVHELMGDADRMRASELAVLLRQVDSDYLRYRNLDGPRLADLLSKEGVPVKVHQGFPKVRAADILRALDRRRDER